MSLTQQGHVSYRTRPNWDVGGWNMPNPIISLLVGVVFCVLDLISKSRLCKPFKSQLLKLCSLRGKYSARNEYLMYTPTASTPSIHQKKHQLLISPLLNLSGLVLQLLVLILVQNLGVSVHFRRLSPCILKQRGNETSWYSYCIFQPNGTPAAYKTSTIHKELPIVTWLQDLEKYSKGI